MISRRDLLRLCGFTVIGSVHSPPVRASRTIQQSTGWPQYQFDAANTGSSASVQGPGNGIGLRWQSTPASDGITTPPTLADGTLYVGSWDDHLYALDAADGSLKWKHDFGSSLNYPAPAVSDGRVIIGTSGGRLVALTTDDGRVDWTVDTNSPIGGSATITNNTVYAPNAAGTLLALSIEDGSERWRFETSGIQPMVTAPAVSDGTVYVGSYGLNEMPEDRSVLDPFVIENKATLEQLDATGKLHAVGTETGEPRWEVETGHLIVASPVVSDDVVYVGSWDKFIYALSPDDGSRQWRSGLSDVIVAPPVLVNDRLYVGAWDGELYSIRTDDGSTVWRTSLDGNIIAPPTSDHERIYASDDKRIVSLRLQDGSERWQFNTQAWDVWAPAIGSEAVYGTDGTGRVFAIEAGTSVQLEASESGDGGSFSGDRGFFSNSGDEPEFLSNVFNLTVLGFLLSLVGIIHQLFQGR